MKSPLPRLVVALCSLALAASAATPTLKIGDPAPKLQTGKWIQGEPVKEFDSNKVYIVEFWATWCGPCRVSIPHLNEIAQKFQDKGLVVIGQDVSEPDDEEVAKFVKKMGNKMTYRVALDDKSTIKGGAMNEAWMVAAGQSGIPTAFIVDKSGKIAWINHPMNLTDQLITQILEGKFDVQKYAAEMAAEQKRDEELQEAWSQVAKARKAGNWDKASEYLESFAKLLPEEQKAGLDQVRIDILFGKKDSKGAYDLIRKVADGRKDQPMVQNALAWKILTDPAIEPRDLELAGTLAQRAVTLTQGTEPSILDTQARVLFMQGKSSEAIALEEKALALADDDLKPLLEKTLASYRKGELPKAD